ncbi:uncharacterized protein LOC123543076 isoform X1 [Mercenaria mercenaria]|uniref:uncharacterized protein LOC123543076 isoform X1 n=1 Tax=Mercenaria mercenaria TaxID=6596 RepID=UPI00234EA75A|nr:uncharacterized protein LOC123543076 isoform X1 [Mercenaria mercenaria]
MRQMLHDGSFSRSVSPHRSILSENSSKVSHSQSGLSDSPEEGEIERFSRYQNITGKHKSQEVLEQPDTLGKKFGHDALVAKPKSQAGLVLEKNQTDILKQSWRSADPSKMSCYRDSYKQSFPIHESCEDWFKVPTLENTIEVLLTKRYGHWAAFGNAPSLFGRNMKSLEKLAFQGQLASRMALITTCYAQQALGSLLDTLSQKNPNVDSAVQNVRDLFAITSKTLDQIGRSGALHHLIRRKSALYDTGLSEYKDYASTVMSLPLASDGIFGSEFDQKLKSKQEVSKQLSDLLPNISSRYSGYSSQYKRKGNTLPPREYVKRPRLESEYKPRSSNFSRIPKTSFSSGRRSATLTGKPMVSQRSEGAPTYKRSGLGKDM